MEGAVTENIGRIVKSPVDGKISRVDAKEVVIKGKDRKEYHFPVMKFGKSNQNTCYSQRPLVSVGDKVKKGDFVNIWGLPNYSQKHINGESQSYNAICIDTTYLGIDEVVGKILSEVRKKNH